MTFMFGYFYMCVPMNKQVDVVVIKVNVKSNDQTPGTLSSQLSMLNELERDLIWIKHQVKQQQGRSSGNSFNPVVYTCVFFFFSILFKCI